MDITTDEVNPDTITKIVNNSDPTRFYSLSEELTQHLTQLNTLEKKIILGNDLLSKTDSQSQISKLQKKNAENETKKKELTVVIKKLELIINSIKDFTLFFIFIRRFYTLAILKKNFKNENENVSIPLINNLLAEEEDLYREFIDGDCFSKVSAALDFETYQGYFKSHAQNFFDNFQMSDPYIRIMSMLVTLFHEYGEMNTTYFNLSEFEIFLSEKISIPLPNRGYELVALRYFFYYEILIEYLKLKPAKTCFLFLKEIICIELKINNYKSHFKKILLYELHNLQSSLHKLERKLNKYLTGKLKDDNREKNICKALIFYNKLEGEFKTIHEKNIHLIQDKYNNEIKMRHLLAMLDDDAHLPKFLQLFYEKIGNSVNLENVKTFIYIETNREALNYLFHAICRGDLYTPHSAFMKEVIKGYGRDSVSLLENTVLEEFIEFSYYYIFSLVYTRFLSEFTKFNNQINYLKLVIYSRLVIIKLERLDQLEERKNEEINKFFKKIFKNKNAYDQHKKNVLEEIKLNLEIIHDIRKFLLDVQSLEVTTLPQAVNMPMPEKNFSTNELKTIEGRIKCCKLDYEKIEKHEFINKENNKEKIKKKTKITTNKISSNSEEVHHFIENLWQSLSCLSENLAFSVSCLKKESKNISLFRQKIFSAIGQISASIVKLLSSLSDRKDLNTSLPLSDLSLPQLLEIINEYLLKTCLIEKKIDKEKITNCHELISSIYLTIDLIMKQIQVIIDKYENFNVEMKETLTSLSDSFRDESMNASFFYKTTTHKDEFQMDKKLSENYSFLKEQSHCLEKLIESIKCDSEDRLAKLYAIILESENYDKVLHHVLKEKMSFFKKTSLTLNRAKNKSSGHKHKTENRPATHLTSVFENTISENPCIEFTGNEIHQARTENETDKPLTSNEKPNKNQKKKKRPKSNSNPVLQRRECEDNFHLNDNLLKVYEIWSLEFEKWKNEKQIHINKLFYIIETCSSIILKTSHHAFLKYLSLYQNELLTKNNELKYYEVQLFFYFQDSANSNLMKNYLNQHQQWFDECFQRIDFSRALLLQSKNDFHHESCQLLGSFADNRAEFNNLLIFYLKITDEYNKCRNHLIDEENKLNDLNRQFVKQVLQFVSLNELECKNSVLSDFSMQLDKVGQLKLSITQALETKQHIKKKLFSLANPSIVNFYLSRIDPFDDPSIEASINHGSTIPHGLSVLLQEESHVTADNYYQPFPVAVYTRT